MANSNFLKHSLASSAALLLFALSLLCIDTTDAQIGVVYGINSRKPPSAKEVIALCNKYNITRMRLYEPNHQILEALRGNIISLILGVANEDIPGIAKNSSVAESWVRTNVVKFHNVNFRYIAVGNDISPLDNNTAKYAPYVVPAMQNIANALAIARFYLLLPRKIKVSTAISQGLLSPFIAPTGSVFALQIRPYIHPVLDFLGKYSYPLLANLHTYLPHMSNPKNVTLDYALFTSPKVVIRDPFHPYYNLFDVLVDAMFVAVAKYNVNNVEIVVSETGWPTAGGVGTNVKNAKTFNNNLIQHVKRGTPFKPERPVETYILGLIDEDLKKPKYNQHWGLFNAKKQLKYPVLFE